MSTTTNADTRGVGATGIPSVVSPSLHLGPLSFHEQLVLGMINVDPRLTRPKELPRLRRQMETLYPVLRSAEVGPLLDGLRQRHDAGEFKARGFEQIVDGNPDARQAAKALGELMAQCGWGHPKHLPFEPRLAQLLWGVGHSHPTAAVYAATVRVRGLHPQPDLPSYPLDRAPRPRNDQELAALGLAPCSAALKASELRILALIHLDPRLTNTDHWERLALLVELFDHNVDDHWLPRIFGRLRKLKTDGALVTPAFDPTDDDADPALSQADRVVAALGDISGWLNLNPDDARMRRIRALRLLGHNVHT